MPRRYVRLFWLLVSLTWLALIAALQRHRVRAAGNGGAGGDRTHRAALETEAAVAAPADRLRPAAGVVGAVDVVGDAPAARARHASAVVAAAGRGAAAGTVRGVAGQRPRTPFHQEEGPDCGSRQSNPGRLKILQQ
ncbi:hypothetical protein G6F65_016546 [Rhizopus arrhizus]|nr:hypothetical protein G6F65_016546 [Rhizopus arrhizus]